MERDAFRCSVWDWPGIKRIEACGRKTERAARVGIGRAWKLETLCRYNRCVGNGNARSSSFEQHAMWIKSLFLVVAPAKAATSTTLSVHTTACGAAYGNWNSGDLTWNPAQWIPTHPFVYASDLVVDPSILSTVVWETDSLNRVKANGVYLYAAHADQAISSTPTNSVIVSDQWKLLSSELNRRDNNCPLPSPPPAPSIPCADSGVYEESLCGLFRGLQMCYCDPSEVSGSFAAINLEVFQHCQHSCGCCYAPPRAPSSPSPPPPLAPMTLE
eukprot:7378469-Prymnesium_polylepis.1